MICSIASSGLEMPPDQNAFQILSIWLLMVPVIISRSRCPRRSSSPRLPTELHDNGPKMRPNSRERWTRSPTTPVQLNDLTAGP